MAGRIPQHFIDELIARSDIVEIIGARVQLKKAGREYKALCPFHTEKTPSFTVSPTKQFFHCFGCGAHGTALGFLMDYDRLEFVEAVEELALRAGLEVPRDEAARGRQPSDALYDILARAEQFYRSCLKDNEPAVEYLRGRGLTGETAATFGIGFAPDRWEALLDRLGKDDSSRQLLLQAGLVAQRAEETGARRNFYDRFRNRIVFPIRDTRGRTIGFGGRLIGPGEPKYLNSPETPLFHKGRELYGLYQAQRALRKIEKLLVVEGYMDVVSLAQHEIRYTVATLGTATTADHLTRLFRICSEVVFCFDGDRAGRQAGWRALQNALPELREGRQIRFLFLPEGEDPDSLVRAEGKAAVEQRLQHAVPLSEFLIGHLTAQVDLDNVDGRARLAELAKPLVNRIPEGVYRQLLIDRLAEKVGLSAQRLDQLLADQPAPVRPTASPRRPGVSPGRGNLVRQTITLVLHHPEIAQTGLPIDDLRGLDRKGVDILVELLEEAASSPNITTAGLLERWRDRPEGRHLMTLAARESVVSADQASEEFRGAVAALLAQEGPERRAERLLAEARQRELTAAEKRELQALLQAKGEPRTPD